MKTARDKSFSNNVVYPQSFNMTLQGTDPLDKKAKNTSQSFSKRPKNKSQLG